MPNCFTLTRKSNPEAGPVPLQQIDEEMCARFDAPCDERKWYLDWMTGIGFPLSVGKSFAEIRETVKDSISEWEVEYGLKGGQELLALIDWLEENFTSDCWVEVG
jgi:hypothetical protein